MRILLDTHVLLWARVEQARLLTVDSVLSLYSELVEVL